MSLKIEIEFSNEIIDKIAQKVFEKERSEKIRLQHEAMMNEKQYSVYQLEEKLGTPYATLTRHIRKKVLIAHRPGKSYIITQTNLNNYINGTHK